ncbi:ABC transporter ATP-binding protein [Niastella populi]|uniref:ABC transporter n=1 Tax=Niastella populi TaxID=550983 RepID=A0A1V9GB78_9BACT|nr:ABC transporter ATP-binding protein [Niastella populi]OQP67830.1 ABC transporter [Niastella populi]
MSIAVKVENLSKIYRLGEIGTGTISHDLQRWFVKLRGKEDPFLKIGETNDRSRQGGNIVYSLKDIDFEINKGDAVGIIGRNGAGKSTLLKILSRITSPTTGRVNIKGRVASLLEVGTGFHPELTGKENIFLNGAMLGMNKREIAAKLDEIIDFSGVERYINTPVKRYSSGMYVRLAFAVAAHLESEILIVDEVLAVGDAEFQKKCLGKMEEVSRGDGRTVLFVSHNLGSIMELCNQGIFLINGQKSVQDKIENVIAKYQEKGQNEIALFDEYLEYVKASQQANEIVIEAKYNTKKELDIPCLGFVIKNSMGIPIVASNPLIDLVDFSDKKMGNSGIVKVVLKEPKLFDGTYYISIWFGNSFEEFLVAEDCIALNIQGMSNQKQYNSHKVGNVLPTCTWNFYNYK